MIPPLVRAALWCSSPMPSRIYGTRLSLPTRSCAFDPCFRCVTLYAPYYTCWSHIVLRFAPCARQITPRYNISLQGAAIDAMVLRAPEVRGGGFLRCSARDNSVAKGDSMHS